MLDPIEFVVIFLTTLGMVLVARAMPAWICRLRGHDACPCGTAHFCQRCGRHVIWLDSGRWRE